MSHRMFPRTTFPQGPLRRKSVRISYCLVALILQAATLHAEPKDIAELFPANTLLYAEVNQPAVVGKDVTAYLKGSVFETSAPSFRGLREKQDGSFNTGEAGLLAAFLAPEMLKEAARFKGLAGGIVGFSKQGEPELLFVALPGDSKLPGFLLRSFITTRTDIRKVTTVEGVDLFQRNIFQYQDDPLLLPGGAGAEGPPQKLMPIGPVYVNYAGLIVVGSNRDHVSAAVRRFMEKEKSASLSSAASFPALREQRARPGILFLADAQRLLEQLNRAQKSSRDADSLAWPTFKNLIPPTSLGTLVARLEIKDDSIRLHARLKLNEAIATPLANLLEGASLSVADLETMSSSSPLTLSIALPSGAQRATRLLTVFDAVVRATGTLGPNASELLQELAEKKLLSIGDLMKVNRIAFSLPSVATWPKNQMPTPALLVYSDDADALSRLHAAIPAILELLGGVKADAVTETIDGVRIRTLEAKASPMGQPIHFGRTDKALAIGTDRRGLADLLRNPTERRQSPEIASVLKSFDKPAMVCVWNWAESIRGPVPLKKESLGPRSGVVFGSIRSDWSPSHPGSFRPESVRVPKEAFERFDGMPPLVVALSRQGNEMLLDIQQVDPKRMRIKGVNHLFEWFVQSRVNRYDGSYPIINSFEGPIGILPLLPPPAP